MTLLDTRPGIAANYRAFVAATGVHVDVELAVSRLGPPLAHELAHWCPPDGVERAVTAFRALYPRHAIAPSPLLPGAREAIGAVHAAGGTVVVITAKLERFARLHLTHVGLPFDHLVGEAFGDGKERGMRELGVTIYVGDHVADMRAAVAAGSAVTPVGVVTGPCTEAELTGAGAALVLPDLGHFPRWLYDQGFPQETHSLRSDRSQIHRAS
ncbi:MAG: HAD family hydrolase [Dactylosporangium sp.]|nr:haloacid dehalogenase-like hydrolase [Dactylosporangium sp.]NNJ62022.1 HAD family hydrolase [Dactylosporangium sp.]